MLPRDLMPVCECDSYLELMSVRQCPRSAGAFSIVKVSNFKFWAKVSARKSFTTLKSLSLKTLEMTIDYYVRALIVELILP